MHIILMLIGAACVSLSFWGLMDKDLFKVSIGIIGVAACVLAMHVYH